MTKQTGFFPSLPADMGTWWDIKGGNFDYAEKAYRAWLEGAEEIQNHAIEFFRARLQKDSAAASELGQCKSAAEAFDLQMTYAGNALADFVDEGQKMAMVLGKVARDSMPSAATVTAAASRKTPRGHRSSPPEAGRGN